MNFNLQKSCDNKQINYLNAKNNEYSDANYTLKIQRINTNQLKVNQHDFSETNSTMCGTTTPRYQY